MSSADCSLMVLLLSFIRKLLSHCINASTFQFGPYYVNSSFILLIIIDSLGKSNYKYGLLSIYEEIRQCYLS